MLFNFFLELNSDDVSFICIFLKVRKRENVVEDHQGKAFVIVTQIMNNMICKMSV